MNILTKKQIRFVSEYLIDLNGTQAAIRSGYRKKSARQQANENLSKPDIQAAIQSAQRAIANRHEFDQDQAFKMFMDSFELAKELNQPASMNSAVSSICKLLGLNEAERRKFDHGVIDHITGFTVKVVR